MSAGHQFGRWIQSLDAEYPLYGRSAGPIRNRLLIVQGVAYEAYRASVLVIVFPGGSCAASLLQQARRCSSRSPVPVVVVEVGQSFAALHLGQQAKPAKASRHDNS